MTTMLIAMASVLSAAAGAFMVDMVRILRRPDEPEFRPIPDQPEPELDFVLQGITVGRHRKPEPDLAATIEPEPATTPEPTTTTVVIPTARLKAYAKTGTLPLSSGVPHEQAITRSPLARGLNLNADPTPQVLAVSTEGPTSTTATDRYAAMLTDRSSQ